MSCMPRATRHRCRLAAGPVLTAGHAVAVDTAALHPPPNTAHYHDHTGAPHAPHAGTARVACEYGALKYDARKYGALKYGTRKHDARKYGALKYGETLPPSHGCHMMRTATWLATNTPPEILSSPSSLRCMVQPRPSAGVPRTVRPVRMAPGARVDVAAWGRARHGVHGSVHVAAWGRARHGVHGSVHEGVLVLRLRLRARVRGSS